MRSPVIDMWAPILPTPELMAPVAEHFPDEMLGYLRVFYKRPPTQESVRARMDAVAQPLDTLVNLLDEGGIERTLITGFDERTSCGKTFVPNALVAAIAAAHPARFIPFAGVDVLTGMRGLRELERLVRERGFRGLSLRPFMVGLPADDRRYYP
jgi:uncharacterized protein